MKTLLFLTVVCIFHMCFGQVNIAYNALVQSDHWGDGWIIVDGRTSTCANSTSLNGDIAYLILDFRREVKITEVHLVFLNTVPLFNVSVIGPNDTNLCSSVLDTLVQEESIAKCGRSLYGQRINITFQGPNTKSTLCEIQIPAGRNMAYRKPTNQTSTYETFYADRAVDGDSTSGTYTLAMKTCTHTALSINPWWVLDLETSVTIQWFRIYDRDNAENAILKYRLQNFRIFLSEDNVNYKLVYQDNNTDPGLVTEPNLRPDDMARFVKIDLNGTARILTLCEVQVFGECENPFYGNCSKPCGHCAYGRQCNKVSGYCDMGGCADGWQTVMCDKTCNDTYYGNCTTSCGHCRYSASCDKINGSCPSGMCSEGWHGEKCDTACNMAYYGQNCASICGYCLNRTCDRFTGNCSKDAGCQPGWQGSRCDIVCGEIYYGNCTTRCGNCRGSAICNKVDGSCPSSLCSEGWNGEKCDIMCDSTHYGQNCAHECGRCINGTCDRITGNCSEASGCQLGWHGSRCDLALDSAENQKINNPIEPSILGGSIGAAVAIIGIIIAIVITIIVKRRKKDKTEKRNETNEMESTSHYMNTANNNSETSTQKTVKTNLEKSKTYYNIEESSAESSESIHKTNWNSLNIESDVSLNNLYEKLRDRTAAEQSTYSTIEQSHMGNSGRNVSEDTGDYDEQLKSLEIELRSIKEKKGVLLERKEKLLRQKMEKCCGNEK